MSQKITDKTIDEETVLVPEIIAQIVAEEAVHQTFQKEISQWDTLDATQRADLNTKTTQEQSALEKYLVERANTTFQYNENFRKNVKQKGHSGTKGRDYLYLFMYHWAGMDRGKVIAPYKTAMLNYERNRKIFEERQEQ